METQANQGAKIAPDELRAGLPTTTNQPSRSEDGVQENENVFELLKVDHDRLASLFTTTANASDPEESEDAFLELYKLLLVHASAEEAVFYPAVAQGSEASRWIDNNIQEHQEAKELAEMVRSLGVNTDDGKATLKQLQAALENHVREEEDYVFKAAQSEMTVEQLRELAQQVYDKRQDFARQYGLQVSA
jgi:iron-sulfur cluster repair protein YtfE (RIC family)